MLTSGTDPISDINPDEPQLQIRRVIVITTPWFSLACQRANMDGRIGGNGKSEIRPRRFSPSPNPIADANHHRG
jgi:hypothetical protein